MHRPTARTGASVGVQPFPGAMVTSLPDLSLVCRKTALLGRGRTSPRRPTFPVYLGARPGTNGSSFGPQEPFGGLFGSDRGSP